jgi:hypothetical protein
MNTGYKGVFISFKLNDSVNFNQNPCETVTDQFYKSGFSFFFEYLYIHMFLFRFFKITTHTQTQN